MKRFPGRIGHVATARPGVERIGDRKAWQDLKRFICRRDGNRVRVFSRRGYDWTDRVPRIAEALAKLRVKSVTIDGEGEAFSTCRCGSAPAHIAIELVDHELSRCGACPPQLVAWFDASSDLPRHRSSG